MRYEFSNQGNALRRVPLICLWGFLLMLCALAPFGFASASAAPGEDLAAKPALETPLPVLSELQPLLQQNPDMVGWLEAGDAIRLPVVQRDNAYYLNHDFRGRRSANGAAFLDELCHIAPPDDHLVIYGHNMRSGAIFGTLRRFQDCDYLKKHCIVSFDTLYRRESYVAFAVFECSAEPGNPAFFDIRHFHFDSDSDFSGYIAAAVSRAAARLSIDVATGDRLLTLLTCSYGVENGRLAVMCRALREGETPETVRDRIGEANTVSFEHGMNR